MQKLDFREQLRTAIDLQTKGDLEGAEAIYARMLQANPRNIDAHQLLGLIYLRQGRSDAAIRSIDQAIAIDPTQPIF